MENIAEWVLCQDFFFESLVSNGNFFSFIQMSRWNKKFYNAMKEYKGKSNVWYRICKKEFKEWTFEKEEEWKSHFSNLKQGDYFSLYSYLDNVLNFVYQTSDKNNHFGDDQIRIIVPLYFCLKKYANLNQQCKNVCGSTEMIAFVTRCTSEKKRESFTLKEFFDWKLTNTVFLNDGDFSQKDTMSENDIFFSNTMCFLENCPSKVFSEIDFKKYQILASKSMHFRHEENCLPYGFEHDYIPNCAYVYQLYNFPQDYYITPNLTLKNYQKISIDFKKNYNRFSFV